MNLVNLFVDFVLNIDEHLYQIVSQYGALTYLIVFFIIFIETGLVLMPFLPGDSLLFVLGALSAQGFLNIGFLLVLLFIAAVLGDSVNYWIGNYFGERVFSKIRFFRKDYLDKTKDFYKKYGNKTIFLARFVPVVRTFAPFVAGIGKMEYKKFLTYNVLGGFVWVLSFLFAGYYFGGLEIVKRNLEIVIIFIILLSIVPPVIEILRRKVKK
jgi:membrane-associated protein